MTEHTAKISPLHIVSSIDKRPPGRAPGLGKVAGSGRKKGVPNKITTDVKETILKRGRPLELLCDVARGIKIRVGAQAGPEKTFVYPNLPDRIRAAETLLSKIVPSMKASEISGPDGTPLLPEAEPQSNRQTARALLALLGTGVAAAGQSNDSENEEKERGATTSGTTFSDSDAAEVSPSPEAALNEGFEVWAPTNPSTSSNLPAVGKTSPEIGEHHAIGNTGAFIELVTIAGDGRESWGVFAATGQKWATERTKEAADAKARELVEARKI